MIVMITQKKQIWHTLKPKQFLRFLQANCKLYSSFRLSVIVRVSVHVSFRFNRYDPTDSKYSIGSLDRLQQVLDLEILVQKYGNQIVTLERKLEEKNLKISSLQSEISRYMKKEKKKEKEEKNEQQSASSVCKFNQFSLSWVAGCMCDEILDLFL